jgi:hypothetical protein
MDEQPQEQKQKRIRRKRLDLQLEQALRDAEAAMTADGATKYLITTRLNVLSQQLARERSAKLEEALAEVERLTAENQELRLKGGKAEETPSNPTLTQSQPTEIDLVLQKYEAERKNKTLASGETPSKTAFDDEAAKRLVRLKSGVTETVKRVTPEPSVEELAEQQAKEAEEKALAEKQRVVERKRQEREHQEKMAALDRELAAEDAKLAELAPAFYIPTTTEALL